MRAKDGNGGYTRVTECKGRHRSIMGMMMMMILECLYLGRLVASSGHK